MNFALREIFNDSVENVWATIENFGGLARYFSHVVNCEVRGSGVGAERTLTLRTPEGGETHVVERLDTIDAKAKRLSYSIADATGFPMRDGYVGIMQLKHLEVGKCELEWEARVEAPSGASEEQTRKFVEAVYRTGFEGLKRIHG